MVTQEQLDKYNAAFDERYDLHSCEQWGVLVLVLIATNPIVKTVAEVYYGLMF